MGRARSGKNRTRGLTLLNILLHIVTHNIVPIFILITVGFIIGKKFHLDMGTLSKLNFYAFMPFFSFVVIYTSDLSAAMTKTLIFAAVFMTLSNLAAHLAARLRKLEDRKKYSLINTVIFYNSGNIGIPLITLIYSGTPHLDGALLIQITIMLFQSLTMNTVGFYNAGRGELHWKESVLGVLRMPVLYSIILAVIFKQIDIDLTASFVWPAFLYLKQALIGFVLVTLGVQLANTAAGKPDPDVALSVLLRLIGGPAAALLILKAAGITGISGQVLFISSSMPTAVNTVLIAIERNAEPDFAAKSVMFSTILCSVTLVLVVYLSKVLFPA